MIKHFDAYILKQQNNKALIASPASKNLQLIITIPAFNEPNIIEVLNNIKQCKPANKDTEVIILLNHSSTTNKHIILQNNKTHSTINAWIELNNAKKLQFHCIYETDLDPKHAGAGLARKLAMDEAVRRFNSINNSNGIIASLDADTFISENYISTIQNAFSKNKKLYCSIFNFKHQINKNTGVENKKAILLYELHLRYFKQALAYTGFPFAYHTIGSCFAVTANAYVKQGGMNRKQAGEDFYFLQKIFTLNGTKELNSVTVYPSSRISDRVPFGTGPALKKIIDEGNYFTYQPHFFEYLKDFFSNIPELFMCNENQIELIFNNLHPTLRAFIGSNDFKKHIAQINSNTKTIKSFSNRFFNWFDALKIIRYLNFCHSSAKRIPITKAAKTFLSKINTEFHTEIIKGLEHYTKYFPAEQA